eukprot:m.213889 g.213889  ORF g.213889 m.213889 type:complete len:281 (-) comp22178_c4_seq5:60-902(-)
MRFEVARDDTLKVQFETGEQLKAESDAVLCRSGNIDVQGVLGGGLFGALGRRLLTGESLFLQELRANGPGEALLGPGTLGDVSLLRLEETGPMLLQRGAFLAAEMSVELSSQLQRTLMGGLFSGTGLFVIRASGRGTLAFTSFGHLHRKDLGPRDTLVVDSQHLVAWPADTPCRFELASRSLWASLTSGEVMSFHLTGPGTVFIQSRSAAGFQRAVAEASTGAARGVGGGGSTVGGLCGSVLGVLLLLFFLCVVVVLVMYGGESGHTVHRGGYVSSRREF